MSLSPYWKGLQKYLTKAKQIEKIDAAISYYLRMYAIQEAMKLIKQRSAEDNKQLGSLMDQVEAAKNLVKNLSTEDAKLKLETYALNVFDHADNEDRARKATREVAQAFLSAATLMEATKQFGEFSSDIEQKLKYARWRAIEINKAVKEGREPVPPSDAGGPMVEDNLPAPGSSLSSASSAPTSSSSSFPPQNLPAPSASAPILPAPSTLPFSSSNSNSSPPFLPPNFGAPSNSSSAPSYASLPAPVASSLLPPPASPMNLLNVASPPPSGGYPSPSTHAASLAVGVATKPVVVPDQPVYRYTPGQPILVYPVDTSEQKMTKIQAIKEGERYTKHALSALSFDDINTAIAKLQTALSVLAPYQTEKRK